MSLKRSLMQVAGGAALVVERGLRGSRVDVRLGSVGSVLVLEYMLPLGCCVHLTPVYEAIKRARPEVTVMVATRGLGAGLLRHNGFVDHVIETADPLVDVRAAARGLKQELLRRGLTPGCTLTGASDQRSRIALVGLLAGTGWRGGFTQAEGLYQRPLRYDAGLSLIDNNLRLCGLVGECEGHVEPRVYFSAADAAKAEELAREANPEGRPLVVMVTQNSGGQRTGWHADRFVEVIRHADGMGCAVAYVGTAGDGAAIEALRVAAGGVGVSVAGRTTVTELAALLARSDVLVSLDTGTMHVGRAVGVPLVVIGPSWQRPLEWLPLEISTARVLRGADRDDIPENYQLDEVQAGDVTAALEDLLRVYPADAGSRAERLWRSQSEVDHRV